MPKTFQHTLRVRFSDVDGMGHVNNAVYFSYLEEARTLFLQKLLGFKSLKEINFILIEQGLRYFKEVRYQEQINIQVSVKKIGNTSFVLGYFLRKGRTKVAEGHTTLVLYDYKRKKTKRLSPAFKKKLIQYGS